MKRALTVNLGNMLLSLSEITDLADSRLARHQQKVAFIAGEMLKETKIVSPMTKEIIFMSSLLHDIGALSIEEKHAILNFEAEDEGRHCLRGQVLLELVPCFVRAAPYVRHSHTRWKDLPKSWNREQKIGAQIILLADFVERTIDRNIYILHQHTAIKNQVSELPDDQVTEEVKNLFAKASAREEFWLDLVSPRLYSHLLHHGPFRDRQIEFDEICSIARMFRHVIDFKSPFTATHTAGVAACAEILAKMFGFAEDECLLMRVAGNLHDIGKMIIPNSILEKPGPLSKDEFAIIKSHTYYSYYVIDTIGNLRQIAEWAAYHHERLDGKGYPFKCKGNELSSGARIMAVADIFTAITEDRPYRKRMDRNKVEEVLKNMAEEGALDKKIVKLLLKNYDKIAAIVNVEQEKAAAFYEKNFRKTSPEK